MNKLLIPSVIGLAAFAGVAGSAVLASSASAATKPQIITAVDGVASANASVPAKAPSGGTVTAKDGVITDGSLPAGTRSVTLPDGSKGVLNAPADFVPGQAPSGATMTN